MICKEFQQDLPLAAADCLTAARLAEVTAHCHHCPECAARFRQLQLVCAAHSNAAKEITELPRHYTGPVVRRSHSPTVRHGIALGRAWRWLLPLGAMTGLAVVLFFRQGPTPPRAIDMEGAVARPTAFNVPGDNSPSLAAYRSALKQPGDASLDALLARHEPHLLPRTADPELGRWGGEL